MEKFANQSNGLIQDGTEVLSGNLDYIQSSKEAAIISRLTDCFENGILSQTIGTPFAFTDNGDGTFSIGTGVAFELGERIIIDTADALIAYDATLPAQTSDDGIGGLVLTPKSTGAANIPITDGATLYVGIKYLLQCDNRDPYPAGAIKTASYSIHPRTDVRLYYTWTDGYTLILSETNSFDSDVVYLGSATRSSLTITFSYSSRHYAALKSILNTTASDIADNIVTTSKILNGAVTGDKLAAAVAGDGLSKDGSNNLKVNTDDTTIEKNVGVLRVKDLGIVEAKIGNGAITETKLGTCSVTESKLGAGAVTNSKISTGAVTTSKIASCNITTDLIAECAVTSSKLAAGASLSNIGAYGLTSGYMGECAVTTSKIENGSITEAKFSKTVTCSGFWDIAADGSYTPAAGLYQILNPGTGSIRMVQQSIPQVGALGAGLIFFDGSSYLWNNNSGVCGRVYYEKF